MPWDPDRYNQFEKERSAPFEDLFGLIKIRPGLDVIDLGCGTGRLTSILAGRLPESKVLGLDASPEMLARAAQYARPGLAFELGRIEQVSGSWDLVFSNAAIQWVPDHLALVPRLLALVRPGGQLVVQIPSNYSHPSHTMILEVAAEPPFRQALGGWSLKRNVLSIEGYAELFYQNTATEITVLEKVYPHVLKDADAVADWTSGTALVPYFERLSSELRDQFVLRYRQRLRQIWPQGPVFYGFRRILFAAAR